MLRTLPLVALGLLVGWAVGRWGAPHLLAALSASSLTRTNYRKRVLVAGLGLLLPLGLLTWASWSATRPWPWSSPGWPSPSWD